MLSEKLFLQMCILPHSTKVTYEGLQGNINSKWMHCDAKNTPPKPTHVSASIILHLSLWDRSFPVFKCYILLCIFKLFSSLPLTTSVAQNCIKDQSVMCELQHSEMTITRISPSLEWLTSLTAPKSAEADAGGPRAWYILYPEFFQLLCPGHCEGESWMPPSHPVKNPGPVWDFFLVHNWYSTACPLWVVLSSLGSSAWVGQGK